jgi:hypothetical protein
MFLLGVTALLVALINAGFAKQSQTKGPGYLELPLRRYGVAEGITTGILHPHFVDSNSVRRTDSLFPADVKQFQLELLLNLSP